MNLMIPEAATQFAPMAIRLNVAVDILAYATGDSAGDLGYYCRDIARKRELIRKEAMA
jgi:hypothetical protein